MSVGFFGERADSPMGDAAVRVPTPVGLRCRECGEVIEEGDRGTVVPVFGTSTVRVLPAHLECDLRGTMSHVAGQCRGQ